LREIDQHRLAEINDNSAGFGDVIDYIEKSL
jgi:hypothetical protein